MNLLEATISDCLEDSGLLNPDREIVAALSIAVTDYFRDEGWISAGEAQDLVHRS